MLPVQLPFFQCELSLLLKLLRPNNRLQMFEGKRGHPFWRLAAFAITLRKA
jgi:hypothetical protein